MGRIRLTHQLAQQRQTVEVGPLKVVDHQDKGMPVGHAGEELAHPSEEPGPHFLWVAEFKDIPLWVILVCALTMAAGTAGGGWRIIRTMGHKMVKMQPVHGFAAETTAALILHVTATIGVPVSTTHVISTSIMGVGATKRLSAVKWGVVERIIWAWVLTLPVTALLGYGLELAFQAVQH